MVLLAQRRNGVSDEVDHSPGSAYSSVSSQDSLPDEPSSSPMAAVSSSGGVVGILAEEEGAKK